MIPLLLPPPHTTTTPLLPPSSHPYPHQPLLPPVPPSFLLSTRNLGSSCLLLPCMPADCAHFVVLIVRASPAWHTNARRARKRARRRLHRTGTVATAQDLAAYRRLREHHGSQPPSVAWICVCCRTENAAYRRKCSNFECRFPGGPPDAWDEKRGKDKRKDKQHLPKHTCHCDVCGEDNSSRRWSCSSCGAKPPESEASSAAAQPKKRRVSQRQNFAEAVA